MTIIALKKDIEKFQSIIKQMEGKKTKKGNPLPLMKLAQKILIEKKEKLAKIEEDIAKTEEENKSVKVVVRIGRSGAKIHPAIAEKYTVNGFTRYRNITPCCNCPQTRRGGDSTFTIISEGHDLWNCRK